jgi:hypothetical protein
MFLDVATAWKTNLGLNGTAHSLYFHDYKGQQREYWKISANKVNLPQKLHFWKLQKGENKKKHFKMSLILTLKIVKFTFKELPL